MTSADPKLRSIAQNRRARHAYNVLEELECGIVLLGTEVKSLRSGRCSIAEAYALVRRAELFLVGAHIPEYSHGTSANHVPTRERKLLLHKRELRGWDRKLREKGTTLVPLQVYFKGARVKVLLGLCRGKKHYDKRQSERERDDRREIERAVARRR